MARCSHEIQGVAVTGVHIIDDGDFHYIHCAADVLHNSGHGQQSQGLMPIGTRKLTSGQIDSVETGEFGEAGNELRK